MSWLGVFARWLWRGICTIAKALFRGAARGAEEGAAVYVARRFAA